MKTDTKEFSHPALNKHIQAIGGKYVLTKEDILRYEEQEILYLTGVAVFDTTCCGSGGCSYAVVPGYVKKWKYKKDPENNPVSIVEPISNDRIREKIKEMILKKETVYQVDFL